MIKILLSRKLGELRWTQADLSRATGIRASTINEMYHELCERVSSKTTDKSASAFPQTRSLIAAILLGTIIPA